MKKYFLVLKTSFLNSLEYRADITSNLLMHLLGLAVLYFIWSRIFSNNVSVGSYDLDSMVTYYMLSGLFIAFFNTRTTKAMEKGIKDGGLANLLIKPINEFLYILFEELGKRLVVIILTTLIFSLPIILIPNVRNTTYFSFHSIIWVCIFSILSNAFLYIFYWSLGCLAFWLKSTSGISNIVNNLQSILKGSWFPIDIAPIFIQNIFSILPFQYTRYFLIKILLNDIPKNLYLKGFLVLTIYTLLFTCFGLILWKRGLKEFDSVGL